MISKESILETLEMLQTKVCVYSFMEKAKLCDCKFKELGQPLEMHLESGCACPELEWVLRYLYGMSDKKWNKLLLGKIEK